MSDTYQLRDSCAWRPCVSAFGLCPCITTSDGCCHYVLQLLTRCLHSQQPVGHICVSPELVRSVHQ
jgi:hypothetical protein